MEPHVLSPEHGVQDAGEDMLAGVLLHLIEPPFPVDGFGSLGPGHGPGGQGIHRVPDDALALMDIRNVEHGAVGQGQGAAVGRLAAALRVKDGAVQCQLSARFARLHSKDTAGGFPAERIGLVIFFSALHRFSSCKHLRDRRFA